jgi:cysteinyl-tRNA synthetase
MPTTQTIPLKLYDSKQKQKVLFAPQIPNEVKVYVCGPTVYDDAHLGHGRSGVVFDLLHRVLKANNYKTTFVKNYTDIDDKIIKKMKTSNKSLEYITSFYIKSYQNDMSNLNILPNTLEPKATQNLNEMISLVKILLKSNKAYKLNDGIYLDTSKDSEYGCISNRASDDSSQARVDGNKNKKDLKDFALWKFVAKDNANDDNTIFKASFGDGRPGWHCECSAMINKHLSNPNTKYAIDIHGGGSDLLFPHHENEASQTRLAYNQEIAKYRLHNGFVKINGEKMSKSLGNSFFLKDIFKLYCGEVVRFYMLNVHYRANFSFSDSDLEVSKKRLDKLYRLKKRLFKIEQSLVSESFKTNIMNALNDDLNTSKSLAIIDEFVANANEMLDNNSDKGAIKVFKKELVANIEFIENVLGFGGLNAYEYFQFGVNNESKKEIENLIKQRSEAKKAKDYKLSDDIRDKLTKMKISISDTSDGVVWERV